MFGMTGRMLVDINLMYAVLLPLPDAATNFTDFAPEWNCAVSTATVEVVPGLVCFDHGDVGAWPVVYFSKSSQNSAVAHGSAAVPPAPALPAAPAPPFEPPRPPPPAPLDPPEPAPAEPP